MKNYKVIEKKLFSLITLLVCCTMVYSATNLSIITEFISNKIDIIKEKEMKFMYSEPNTLENAYNKKSNGSTDVYQNTVSSRASYLPNHRCNSPQDFMFLKNNYSSVTGDKNLFFYNPEESIVIGELKKQIEEDSYRNKNFGLYYIFDFEYTINTLKQLDLVIEKTAKAQKMPKAFLSAVLFREMMFIGQEDLLDGVPVIGGETIGICQIGVKNIRLNEQIVHSKDSVIANKADDEIKEMLRNPEQAIYFCAVQLKARAIQLAGKNADLNKFDKKHMKQILAAYNQSEIPFNIGPVMNKEKYAEQTYKYYELLSKYYGLEKNK